MNKSATSGTGKGGMIWFACALALQLIVLAVIPLQQAPARIGGTEIVLEAQARYPHGTVTGFEIELDYDITNIVPADQLNLTADGVWFYLILAPDTTDAWQAVNYQTIVPMNLAPDRCFIAAEKRNNRLVMGIETYHFPEGDLASLREALENSGQRARVAVMVDPAGNPALQELRVGGEAY
jgi:uncharacterized membrane-anchored protein